MSSLTALARAHAVMAGRAEPIATVAHIPVVARPVVCVPLALAGEANAPLAVIMGTSRTRPDTVIVAQPRNRDERFEFADTFGRMLLRYLASFPAVTSPPEQGRWPASAGIADAPQVWVPNRATIAFLRLLGRSTRFRSPQGPYPVPPTVPLLGRWLTFLTERAETPGSAMLVAATQVLEQHWASGQSSLEDQQLASLMAWIAPPPGQTGAQAARQAEDPLLHPPAGPATDPSFDREVLQPGMRAYDTAADPAARQRARDNLHAALHGQLEPTWQLMWDAIDLLRRLPVGAHVPFRWQRDVHACAEHHRRVQQNEPPQPKRDSAVRAAIRLSALEQAAARYEAQRALDDPLVMAEHRLAGEAFEGEVVAVDRDRRIGRSLTPHIVVATADPVRLSVGEGPLYSQTRPTQQAYVVSVADADAGCHVTLQLSRGMGGGRTPKEGSVPMLGEQVCYCSLTDGYTRPGRFPAIEDTPWTHGGPPVAPSPRPDDADAREEWA